MLKREEEGKWAQFDLCMSICMCDGTTEKCMRVSYGKDIELCSLLR